LTARLKKLLEQTIPPDDWYTNHSEIDFWNNALRKRGSKGTMTAWARVITNREKPVPGPSPAMEDDRIAYYRAERDRMLAATPTNKSEKPRRKS
jgi:hypothetical protein